MTRVRFTPKAVMAAALGFIALAADAVAAPINPNASTATATYRLTASEGLPTPSADISGPQVVAMVTPAGGVIPPVNAEGQQGSPLTILSGSTGFDADQLVVALKDATNDAGEPEQLLGLVFFGQGFQPGGVLEFALSIDPALVDTPPTLVSSTPGVTITALLPVEPGDGDGDGGSDGGGAPVDPTPNVPEPVGVLIWSVAGVGVALRVRANAKARREAASVA